MGKLSSPCIDTSFDFTSDVPGYWDHFWDNNDVFGKTVEEVFCFESDS